MPLLPYGRNLTGQNGTLIGGSWAQVAGPSIFTCNNTPPTGSLVATCNLANSSLTGTVANTDAPSGTVFQYELYVNGALSGRTRTTDNTGYFDLTGASLPTALSNLELTTNSLPVAIYAYAYSNGAPITTGSNVWHIAANGAFTCNYKDTSGTVSVSCPTDTISGTVQIPPPPIQLFSIIFMKVPMAAKHIDGISLLIIPTVAVIIIIPAQICPPTYRRCTRLAAAMLILLFGRTRMITVRL